jgi:ADP-ribosyltransferase exoenzyme
VRSRSRANSCRWFASVTTTETIRAVVVLPDGSQALLVCAESAVAFDPNQPRDQRGRWRKLGNLPPVFEETLKRNAEEAKRGQQGGGLHYPSENVGPEQRQVAVNASAKIAKVADIPGEGPPLAEIPDDQVLGAMIQGYQLGGRYLPGENKIQLNPDEDANLSTSDLFHETGHWLDHQKVEAGLDKDAMASTRIYPPKAEQPPEAKAMKQVMDAIAATPSNQRLHDQLIASAGSEHNSSWFSYATRPPEEFARAWAQYVYTEGGTKPNAKDWVETKHSDTSDLDRYLDIAPEEFEPVADAFANLIKAKGWEPKGGALKPEHDPPAQVSNDVAEKRYEIGWSTPVNNTLRGRDFVRTKNMTDPEIQGTIKALDRAIEEDGVEVGNSKLYRGLDAADLAPAVRDAIDGHGSFSDAGFTSTTGALGVAGNFAESHVHPQDPIILRIRVPEGTKALQIESPDDSESERLLPRGGTFRVVSQSETTTFPGGPKFPIFDVTWSPPGSAVSNLLAEKERRLGA